MAGQVPLENVSESNLGQITRGKFKRRSPHGDTKYLLGTVV
jgi:hypothetical protein